MTDTTYTITLVVAPEGGCCIYNEGKLIYAGSVRQCVAFAGALLKHRGKI